MAREMGVDIFKARSGAAPEREVVRGKRGLLDDLTVCEHIYYSVILQTDGGILPCCYLFYKKDDFGHIKSGSLRDTRNNERFIWARKLFDSESLGRLPKDLEHSCLRCSIVHRQSHLQNLLRAGGHEECIDAWQHTAERI
jgi:hypothetical protein